MLLQHLFPRMRQTDLSDGRRCLLFLETCSRPLPRPSCWRPSAIAPDDTRRTSWPRARNAATSAANVSSQALRTLPLAASTNSAEPTLMTTRRACDSGWLDGMCSFGVMVGQSCGLARFEVVESVAAADRVHLRKGGAIRLPRHGPSTVSPAWQPRRMPLIFRAPAKRRYVSF